MDKEKYKDIAPFDGSDAINAAKYIHENNRFVEYILSTLYKNVAEPKWDDFEDLIKSYYFALGKVKSWKDFQTEVIHKIVMPLIVEASTDGVIVNGLDKIDVTKPHIIISNHRDIVLDSAFLLDALLSNGGLHLQPATGANLYMNKEAEICFGLFGSIKVFRGLGIREEYECSLKLSNYIWDLMEEGESSVWIAGSAGRSKDGIDVVLPSIIKMLILSRRKKASLSELVNQLSIVPVSISYEKDPNDVNKARELIATILSSGNYKKKRLEDLLSLVRGIKNYKRRVAINFSAPLSGEFQSPEDVSREIEKQIRLSYELFPISYYAWDKIHKTDKYKSMYIGFNDETEEKRFNCLRKSVNEKVLEAYAAPLESKLLYSEGNEEKN